VKHVKRKTDSYWAVVNKDNWVPNDENIAAKNDKLDKVVFLEEIFGDFVYQIASGRIDNPEKIKN